MPKMIWKPIMSKITGKPKMPKMIWKPTMSKMTGKPKMPKYTQKWFESRQCPKWLVSLKCPKWLISLKCPNGLKSHNCTDEHLRWVRIKMNNHTGPMVNQVKKWCTRSWSNFFNFMDWVACWWGRYGCSSLGTKVLHELPSDFFWQ